MTKLNDATETHEVPEMIASTAQEMPVAEAEEQSIPEVVEPQQTQDKPAKPPEPTEETPPGCPHYFGYLGTRPRKGAIPEQCLTCRKMIKCTFRT